MLDFLFFLFFYTLAIHNKGANAKQVYVQRDKWFFLMRNNRTDRSMLFSKYCLHSQMRGIYVIYPHPIGFCCNAVCSKTHLLSVHALNNNLVSSAIMALKARVLRSAS